MVDELQYANRVRSYEVSIWTLQDRFLSILKWATMDCKGQIQTPEIVLRDDGTQEFSFSIPKFYYNGNVRIENPMWLHLENQPLEANMHKLKVVFNKNTADEAVLEFFVTQVTHDHTGDSVVLNVQAEGLAFHELGKIGYKISLSEENYTQALERWEKNGLVQEQPLNNIQFWNDLVFKDSLGNWKTNWKYEVRMDWSSFSSIYDNVQKESNIVYEDEYVSSWYPDNNQKMMPREIQATREKCRLIDVSESNIYNITQDIAKEFGVFCRYEYSHDSNYQITGRTVIYYNNYIQDMQGHIDLTYPYSSSAITRTIDNSNVTTKMHISGVDYDSDVVTIMDVDANKSKEAYLLNFDYLKDIQGISEEQYAEIDKFELEMYNINTELTQVQERIRVITNQLVELEAQKTTYENAVALDTDRWREAGQLRAELTGGSNLIKIDGSPCTVLWTAERGYYVNIRWEGLERSRFKLYQTSNFTGSDKSYSNMITGFQFSEDEFHNINRIEHITPIIPIQEGDTIWAVGYYNPTLAYDNIQAIWKTRLNYDQTQLKKVEAQIKEYNRYLNGNTIEEEDLSTISYPLAIIWGDPDNPLSSSDKTKSDKIGQCRIIANDAAFRGWNYDYFSEFDAKKGSPDLYYQEEQLINQKLNLISKFERMMGPALREGYWNPENYHDYGDLFKDDFVVHYIDSSIVQPKTSHLSFIWDGDNYYEAEEPLIYASDTAGNYEQHLVINISDCLTQVSQHLDDLCFVYCNPMNVATIEALNSTSTAIENKSEWIASLESTKYYSYRIGSGCELGWVARKVSTNATTGQVTWERFPALIVTGAKELTDEVIEFIRTNKYTTKIVSVDNERIETRSQTTTQQRFKSFIGYPQYDSNGNIILNSWNTIKIVGGNSNAFIGTRKITAQDFDGNGTTRMPTPQEHTWVRQYPRLYFDTLKLQPEEIKIFQNMDQLTNNEDYYTLEDDRSVGLKVAGIGYYTTIKPEFLFSLSSQHVRFSVIYKLSNLDVAIYLDAIKVMYENSRPKVSYNVELSLLNPDFVHSAYSRLNQIVHINDNDLGLENVSGYISTVTLMLDRPWEDTVEIKNYETKFEDLFTTIVAQTEAMKSNQLGLNNAIQAFTSTGLISPEIVRDSMRSANLNLAFNSGKLTIDEEKGIWGVSDSGVVAFRGGGIFTATDKDNSGNWMWNTGILPTGINANLITSGQLDTNKIKIYAGDELKFQWNGEGLYAYKSFKTNHITIQDTPVSIPSNYIDGKQYVVFNSEGLFLRSEADSYIEEETTTSDNMKYYTYRKLDWTVDRVEVSWRGLILRNWNKDEVFYADPNTGDLTLTGTINANAGEIGGWTINEKSLLGSGINLVSSADGQNDAAGIYLTNSTNYGESIIIDNKRCYRYTYNGNNVCYYPYFTLASPTQTLDPGTAVYVSENTIVSVEPKYLDVVKETTSSSSTHISDPTEDSPLSVEENVVVETVITHMYIVKSSGSKTHVKDSSGREIEYDGSTSPSTSWYARVKAADSNYTSYITETRANVYVEKILSTTNSVVITSSLATNPTFSVTAKDGSVYIRKGQVGNYVIDTTSEGTTGVLSNSQLNLNNYFTINGTQVSLGQVFYNITANSEEGTFSLFRLNGATENFNVAAMQAYKNAVAAAGTISLVLSYENNVVTATATSGLGLTATQSMTIVESGASVNDNSSGGSPSSCSGCSSSCSQSCATDCGGNCYNACAKASANGCTDTCMKACNNTCTGECVTECTGGCEDTCKDGCERSCTGGCEGSCTGGCKGTCRTTCVATMSGRGSCLLAGTLVWLADHTFIPIEDLEVGMKVFGYNEEEHSFVIDTVVEQQTFKHTVNLVDLHFSSGEVLTATKGHPFLTTEGWKALDVKMCNEEQHYIEATQLHVGDCIMTFSGKVTLQYINERADLNGITVYNCKLEKYHTYLVGSGLITHNAKNTPLES